MKKNRVPFKAILKMALKCGRPVRYAFTVLLFVMALTMTGLSLDIGLYNVKRVKIETYSNYISSFSVASADAFGWQTSYYPLKEEDLKALERIDLPGARVAADDVGVPSILDKDRSFEYFSLFKKEHLAREEKLACANSDYLDSLKIVAGDRKLQDGNILLSACFANLFLEDGQAESYTELIGQKKSFEIGTSTRELIISGVYRSSECDAYKALQEGKRECDFHACEIYNIVTEEQRNSLFKPVGAAFVTESDFEEFATCSAYMCFLGDFRTDTGREMEKFFKENKNTLIADMFENLDIDSETIGGLKTGFLCFGLVLMAFSVLLIYQFISLTIDEERPKIALLRALGGSRKSVIGIYLLKSGLMGFLSGVCAIILTLMLIPAGNKVFALLFGEQIAVLTYHPLVFLTELLLCLLSSLLSALIPVLLGINKSPVEDMKLR